MNQLPSNPMFQLRNKPNNGQRISFGINPIDTPIPSSQFKRRSTLLSTPASNVKRRQSSTFNSIVTTRPPSQTPLRNSQTVDLRPIKDKKYQELIQKEVYSFLVENKFELKTNITLTETTLKSPTQKNFNEIFKFLFNQLEPSYVFQKPVDQEMITLLKVVKYPFLHSISRSHFAAVGGSNWPNFLGILYWLVKLNLELTNLTPEDFIVEDEFDRIHIKYTTDSYDLFINGDEEGDVYYESMKSKLDELRRKLDSAKQDLSDQRDELIDKINSLEQQVYERDIVDEKTIALEDDFMKLKAFNETVKKRIPEWNSKLQESSDQLESLKEDYNQSMEEKKQLVIQLQNSNKSENQINQLFITRDQLSKDIESITDKISDLKSKLHGKSHEFDSNFDKLNKLCGQYNDICRSVNHESEYKFSITINQDLNNESKGFAKHEIFSQDPSKEFNHWQQKRIDIDNKRSSEYETTRQINEEFQSIVEKIKEQTLNIEELKSKDNELKKNIEEVQQQMYIDQENYSKEINKMDHQSREIKNSISADILELEGKLRDTYIIRSKVQEEISLKRQEMDEYQTRISSFVINFRTDIQEKLIKVDDLIQPELEKV